MATSRKLRAMVDANVLVAGTGWPRFPFEVLQHALDGDFQLVLSQFIIEEARRNINRLVPHMLPRFEQFLVLCKYELAPDPDKATQEVNKNLVRDANDVPVALAAINAQVDFLITQDRDFTDEDETTETVRRLLNIILPGTFLREHMGWTSEALEAVRNRSWE